MSWLSRLVNVFRSERVGDALDDEQAFHVEAATSALIDEGRRRKRRRPRHVVGSAMPARCASGAAT